MPRWNGIDDADPGAIVDEMKTTELIQLLWRAVNEADELPPMEAEQRLYASLQRAVMAYEDKNRQAPERRCMICNVPVSQCSC